MASRDRQSIEFAGDEAVAAAIAATAGIAISALAQPAGLLPSSERARLLRTRVASVMIEMHAQLR
jgi:hypothetical protein